MISNLLDIQPSWVRDALTNARPVAVALQKEGSPGFITTFVWQWDETSQCACSLNNPTPPKNDDRNMYLQQSGACFSTRLDHDILVCWRLSTANFLFDCLLRRMLVDVSSKEKLEPVCTSTAVFILSFCCDRA